ncbi:MAG TPA: hypothetical protein VK969_12755 [Acidimicrobiia bacterium]|nr:hypothetical protein [Acidimicrobiia bacterium]
MAHLPHFDPADVATKSDAVDVRGVRNQTLMVGMSGVAVAVTGLMFRIG